MPQAMDETPAISGAGCGVPIVVETELARAAEPSAMTGVTVKVYSYPVSRPFTV